MRTSIKKRLGALGVLAATSFGAFTFAAAPAQAAGSGTSAYVWDYVNQCRFNIHAWNSGELLNISASFTTYAGDPYSCATKLGSGGVITQIVCEKYSSAVANWPYGYSANSTWSNGNEWCYGRFRVNGGFQKWGTEYRINWVKGAGWFEAYNV
jgi:hypothetical protein